MRLRFSIRDLLWLTLVVALAVGWWLDHAQSARIKDEFEMKMLEAQIKYLRLKDAVDEGHPELANGGHLIVGNPEDFSDGIDVPLVPQKKTDH